MSPLLVFASSLAIIKSQHHDDLPALESVLVLAKDSGRQVLEVGLLRAAVDGREFGVRVYYVGPLPFRLSRPRFLSWPCGAHSGELGEPLRRPFDSMGPEPEALLCCGRLFLSHFFFFVRSILQSLRATQ